MDDITRFDYLFEKYRQDIITTQELAELMQLIKEGTHDKELKQIIGEEWMNPTEYEDIDVRKRHMIMTNILESEKHTEKIIINLQRRSRKKYWMAAAVIAMLVASFFLFRDISPNQDTGIVVNKSKTVPEEVLPGGNKAVLILDDGSKIELDNARKGFLAEQEAATVIILDEGTLAYNAVEKELTKVEYNTLSTPKGGKYIVELPDGSKIWLNALSSLRYPTAFSENERKVELTGEAYFEIAKYKNTSFKVMVNNTEVEVLGTHFNIMAYSNEAFLKTTLLEGAVKINNGKETISLTPGQQAQVNNANGRLTLLPKANTQEAVAWKNDQFYFENASVQDVMKQLERWYDIDVYYDGQIPEKTFTGKIQRNLVLSRLLKGLQQTGFKFTIEGNKVTVKP
jgi:transmembrane sensor